ncbi:MAG: molybdate ABC transporter permease subunit [Undibacterium sp.]|nr:molybdate ABC transporter permease subunit [Undibacterium sp.]
MNLFATLLSNDWQPLLLSFELAGLTSLILFFIGVPLAYVLAFSTSRFKPVWEALVSMPIVLPPSVLGFYLLLAFRPQSGFGLWLVQTFDLRLAFSFTGIVIGSVIFSLPFMVQPIQAGLQALPRSLSEVAYTLGQSPTRTLFRVLLPNIKASLFTGAVLCFAHTLGEFGVVLMIGGNIPGVTRVASIAIYDEVESLHYAAAHFYSLVLMGLSFVILLSVYWLKFRHQRAEL